MEKKRKIIYTLHTFNGISTVLAVVVMALCLWLRYEWDYKHFIFELEAQQVLWTGPYILMASSITTMITIVIGIWATIIQSRKHLSFALGCTISAILGVAGAAYTLDHGIFRSKLTPWLEERFFQLFHQMDYDERSARTMRIIQEEIECCGPSGWTDYQEFNKIVPDECRNPDTGNIMNGGCAEEFSLWVEPRTGWVSGMALLLVAIQLVTIFVSLWLRRIILQERTKNKSYNVVSK